MQISRKEFIRLAGLVAAGASVQACTPVYRRLVNESAAFPEIATGEINSSFPILNRLTFGPRIEERVAVSEIGMAAWIEEQLAPESIQDTATAMRVRKFDALLLSADELDGWEKRDVVLELKQASILRQIYSKRQIYEMMVEFWSDHFNITVAKSEGWRLKVVDDREVIRKHAMGNFRDLLWASAHSPAMMVYLDNHANHKDHPNENYARELLELHTLGVYGGYSQTDVMELARCLTGWRVKKHFWAGDFTFDAEMHDDQPKVVLGEIISPNGISEGERVLEMLAIHPATAHFIATKLVRKFICDDPEVDAPGLVEEAAQTFIKTKGDITSVLKTVLYEGLLEVGDGMPSIAKPKFKRPVNFITSALRMLNADTNASGGVLQPLANMGQPTFQWPTPDGPPDVSSAWSSNLLPRWRFALGLMLNEIGGTKVDIGQYLVSANVQTATELIDTVSNLLLGAPYPPEQRDALAMSLEGQSASQREMAAITTAGLISSPAFQWR